MDLHESVEEQKNWPFGEVAADGERLTEDLATSDQGVVPPSPAALGMGGSSWSGAARIWGTPAALLPPGVERRRTDSLSFHSLRLDSAGAPGTVCAPPVRSPALSSARAAAPSMAAARPAVVCSSLGSRHAPLRRDRSWGTLLGALQSTADSKGEVPAPRTCLSGDGPTHGPG